MQDISFDIISDLNLKAGTSIDWENKVTSLYCIIAGNISSDLNVLTKFLVHLSLLYQGVFFVPGLLDYDSVDDIYQRTEDLQIIADALPNVCILHQQVIVIDGVAILGANGWSDTDTIITETVMERYEDHAYLQHSLKKLQRHQDVKKIIIVSSCVPDGVLYYGTKTPSIKALNSILIRDTEKKVSHWVFGSQSMSIETTINNIKYMNNPCNGVTPYWPKRLLISV